MGSFFDIEFFKMEELPELLLEEAQKKGIKLEKGIIAVKTTIASIPEYEFIQLGNKVEDYMKLISDLAEEDGVNLEDIYKNLVDE